MGLIIIWIIEIHSCCVFVFAIQEEFWVGCSREVFFLFIYTFLLNLFPLDAFLCVGVHFGFSLATSTTTPSKHYKRTNR